MDKEQLEENLDGYCEEICRFVREKDYSSAQRLVSGLRGFIAGLKKEDKEEK